MNLKRFAAVIAAALTVAASAPSVYAEYGYDYNYDYNNYDYNDYNYNYDYNNDYSYDYGYDNGYDNGYGEVTTTAAPTPEYDPAQTAGNEVTSMENKPTAPVTDKPTSAPSRVYLKPGEMKDGKVSVELRIEADASVSGALMSVAFDTATLQLTSTQINPEAGGVAAENSFNGKYVFNYTNDAGSKYKGNYVTLNFDVLDKNMVSSTLFLTVTTLDNKTGVPISYSVDNGIVTNPDVSGEQGDQDTPKYNKLVRVQKSKVQAEPSEMNIENYRNIVVADDSIVSFENGIFKFLAAGETSFDVVFNDDTLETYDIIIIDDTITTDGQDRTVAAADNSNNSGAPDKTVRNLLIVIAVALTMVIIAVEYLIIMKPTSKRRKKLAAAEAFFEREDQLAEVEAEVENDEEMRADLQKAFAARDARRKAAHGEEPEQEINGDQNEDTDAEISEENDDNSEE